MIYTSYFGNLKNLPEDKFTRISICNSQPSFLIGKVDRDCGKLVGPSLDLLYDYKNGKINEKEYIRRYLNQLESTVKDDGSCPFVDILAMLNQFQSKDIVLLCYERPEDFCHRHILADWLNKNYNAHIEEYPIYKKK